MTQRELISFIRATDMGAELDDKLLLTMLLCDVMPGYDSELAANELIERYGSFANVCEISFNTLANTMGVGTKGACLIKLCKNAVFNLLRQNSSDECRKLFATNEIVDYMRPLFLNLDSEQIYIAYLNSRNRLITCKKLAEGDFEHVPFDFMRIVKDIARYDSTAIVLAHNHKINTYPSEADISVTNKLNRLLHEFNAKVVDHIIFCENSYKSLKESGYIKELSLADKLNIFPK